MIFFLFFVAVGHAQTAISGVVNDYVKVVSVDGTDKVSVTNASAFSVGDTVLLEQMKGVGILVDKNFGSKQNSYNTGKYEFLIIQNISGNQVVFTADLTNTYEIKGALQLIRVPGYSNAVIKGMLTCQTWDSTTGTGGVVAIFVGNTLTLNGDIDVSGKGFTGGMPVAGNGDCGSTDSLEYSSLYYSVFSDSAGSKGEGVASYAEIIGHPLYPGYARGRGPLFTGGGGGNARHSGGGGGANFGKGGDGGTESSYCETPYSIGGAGGYSLDGVIGWETENRIFMGGGGGSGDQSGGLTATAGGRGGGIVILLVDTLVGNNHVIRANGATVIALATAAGGGGGAGGSVLLDVDYYKTDVTVEAKGGDGGGTNGTVCSGPGGGGGGGLVWHNNNATLGNLHVDVSEGNGGSYFGGSSCGAYFGNSGTTGIEANDLHFVLSGFLFNSIFAATTGEYSDTLCEGETIPEILGSNPRGGVVPYHYAWENSSDKVAWAPLSGETGANLNLNIPLYDTTYYRRIVTDSTLPTPITDISKILTIIVQPEIIQNEFGFDTIICHGQIPDVIVPVFASPKGGDGTYTYFWEESTDDVIFTPATGMNTGDFYQPPSLDDTTFYRRFVYSGKCSSISDTVIITVLPSIVNNAAGGNQTICQGIAFYQLTGTNPSGGDNNYIYKWIETPDHGSWNSAYGVNNTSSYQPDTSSSLFPGGVFYRRVVFSGLNNTCADTSNEVVLREWPGIKNNVISADQHICEGDIPSPLSGSTPLGGNGSSYAFVWEQSSDNMNFIPGTEQNTNIDYISGSLNDTTYYRRIVLSDVCRDTSIQLTIVVDPAILHDGIRTLSGTHDTIVCSGQPLNRLVPETTPIAGGNGIYDYTWNISEDGGNTWNNAGGNTLDYDPGTLHITTLVRRMVTSGMCQVISDTVTLHILPAITQNTLPDDFSICEEDSTLIPGNTPSGGDGSYIYTWEESNDGTVWNGALGNNGGQNYQTQGLSLEKYFRRIVFSGPSNTCRDTTPPLKISIYPLPSVVLEGMDTDICDGTSVDLTFQVTGANGPWTLEYDDGQGNISSGMINDTFPKAIPVTPGSSVASTQYTYSISSLTDGVGCKARSADMTGTALVRVDGQPQANAGQDKGICGLTSSVQATIPSFGTAHWSVPAGVSLNDSLEALAQVTASSEGPYTLSWQVANGVCPVATDDVTITFWQDPGEVTVYPADTTLEPGIYTISLEAKWQPHVGIPYWSTESQVEIDNDTSSIIHVRGLGGGKNIFNVYVRNGACQTDPVTATVTVLEFKSENYGISPNGDKLNDYFKIEGAENIENKLLIFNVMGVVIFQTENFMHEGTPLADENGWNGVDNNNEPLPEGTYYYVLELKGKIQQTLKGFIVIKRQY